MFAPFVGERADATGLACAVRGYAAVLRNPQGAAGNPQHRGGSIPPTRRFAADVAAASGGLTQTSPGTTTRIGGTMSTIAAKRAETAQTARKAESDLWRKILEWGGFAA